MLRSLLDPLLSVLYPQFCGSCGEVVETAADGPACADCWKETKIFDDLDRLCPKCGAFLVRSVNQPVAVCRACDDHHYDQALAAGEYSAALAVCILQMKRVPSVPYKVRELLISTLTRMDLQDEYVVIPVPLSKKRFLERGFNQSTLLAQVFSRSGFPIDYHSLIRNLDTPMHRSAMDRKARETTVENAFQVVRPNLIIGRNILLVDDLMTSGSTVSQCARVLKKSGAKKVVVLTLARAA